MGINHDPYASGPGLSLIEDGGVSSARGFKAAGMHAGFRKNATKPDLAVVVADEPCAAAATFTQNIFCAAPVAFSKRQLEASSGNPGYGVAKAVVINSGNANAATGTLGMQSCEQEARIAASALGCPDSEVLIASTGVIGVQLPMQPFEEGLPKLAGQLSADGMHDAARAIMTTDTVPKECAVKFDATPYGYEGAMFTVGGMSKGSGMIMPNMATMICVLTTDAPIAANHLHALLKSAVDESFNRITVDSDTSTNDTCFALASGAAAKLSPDAPKIQPGEPAYDALESAFKEVCICLARKMAADGEGASKLVDVTVRGAATAQDADLAARTIANSPLVKTAIAGHDANWGRIAAALGRSGASFSQYDVDIDMMGMPVMRSGLPQPFSEEEALARFEEPEILIDVNLNSGPFEATIWTCDFTHDYISINADYRT